MTKGNSKKGTAKPTSANRKNFETTTTVTKMKTPNFTGTGFHQINVNTPCQIFVDKTTSAMYITTNETTLTNKRTNR
jgi:hypothetical protein